MQPDLLPALMRRATLALVAAAVLFVPAPSAHAATVTPNPGVTRLFLAYGEGVSRCDVTLTKRTGQDLNMRDYGTLYSGRTTCNVPVEQTARATLPADGAVPALDGGLCSGVRTSCTSGGNLSGKLNRKAMTYRITLRAPTGQGWVGDPTFCSGVGTDNLTCTFELNDTTLDDRRVVVDPGIVVGPCACDPIDLHLDELIRLDDFVTPCSCDPDVIVDPGVLDQLIRLGDVVYPCSCDPVVVDPRLDELLHSSIDTRLDELLAATQPSVDTRVDDLVETTQPSIDIGADDLLETSQPSVDTRLDDLVQSG